MERSTQTGYFGQTQKDRLKTKVDARGLALGREETTYFELLAEAILTHWKPTKIDWQSVALNEANQYQAQSKAGFTYFY